MPRCIYCAGLTTGLEQSLEHPFPEALGFPHPLPRGAADDACNHKLKRLDQEFCDYLPIRTAKIYAGVLGKGNRVREVFAEQGGFVQRFDPVANHHKLGVSGPVRREGNAITFETPVLRADQWLFSRSVHKIGLGLLAFRCEPSAALDPRFDAARRYIRQPVSRSDWRHHAERAPPGRMTVSRLRSPEFARLNVRADPESGFVFFSYFGNEFVVNLASDLGVVLAGAARFFRDATGDDRVFTVVPDGAPMQWELFLA